MHEITTLPSGLTVATQKMLGVESATVLVLVKAGSRYETREVNGIAHFLEHIFFKGGKRYKSSAEVAAAIDSVGGEFNAFTGKEYAGYYVKVAKDQMERAWDVLSDMLLDPQCSEEDVERERGVIIQEYEMYQDTPMYQIGWEFERLLFGDQPLGWDQIGTKEFLENVKKQDLLDFRGKLYRADNTVIAVAGNVEHGEVVESVKKYFPMGEEQTELKWEKYEVRKSGGRVMIKNKKTEQAHMMLGVEGLDMNDERRYVQSVLAAILGGGMSSRMFLEVREKLSLCYSIRTSADTYMDTGMVATYAGVPPQRLKEAVGAMMKEYRQMREEGVGEEELKKSKEYLKGSLTLSQEDSEEVAHGLGRQWLLKGEVKGLDEIRKKIDSVTSEQVQELAREILAEGRMKLAVIGLFGGQEEELEKLI